MLISYKRWGFFEEESHVAFEKSSNFVVTQEDKIVWEMDLLFNKLGLKAWRVEEVGKES